MDYWPTVLVVGGGAAGMTAASALAGAGVAVGVIEAAAELGGRFGVQDRLSFEHGGRSWRFPAEHGLHGIWPRYRNVRRLLREAGSGDDLVATRAHELLLLDASPPRLRRMEIGRATRRPWLPNGAHFGALIGARPVMSEVLGPHAKAFARAARDAAYFFAFDHGRDVEALADVSVQDLVGDWPPALRQLAEALVHASFFRPAAEADLAAFLAGVQQYVLYERAASAFSVLRTPSDEALFTPLARAVRAAGGRVQPGVRAVGINFGRDGAATSVRVRVGGRTRRITADAVILALDPEALTRLVAGTPLATTYAPAGARSANVRLWYTTRPRRSPAATGLWAGDGAPVDTFFWLDRLQRDFATWGHTTGGGVVECHLYSTRADAASQYDDADLAAYVAAAVERAWPELAGTRVHHHVMRHSADHPRLEPGCLGRFPEVKTASPNVALCGDWITPPWPCFYLEQAVVTGLVAARTIAERAGTTPDLIAAPLPPEPASKGFVRLQRAARAARAAGLLRRLGS